MYPFYQGQAKSICTIIFTSNSQWSTFQVIEPDEVWHRIMFGCSDEIPSLGRLTQLLYR